MTHFHTATNTRDPSRLFHAIGMPDRELQSFDTNSE
jgi:hypothetical protein